jgi:hypothetical protein
VKPLPILSVLVILTVSAFVFLANAPEKAEPSPQSAPIAGAPVEAIGAEVIAAYEPLAFGEIFITPAGPKGLEYTDKAKSVAGKKIQIKGYMVRYPHPDPKLFIFSPIPMVLNYQEYRLADSLAPEAIHVITPVPEGKAYSFYRHEMLLLGTIEYGPHTEVDGRISHIRLRLDHALDAKTLAPEASLAMQGERLLSAERLKDPSS